MPRPSSYEAAVDQIIGEQADRRRRAIALHDLVRDEVAFGFTPWFDAARPRHTWRLGLGHCNPQAALMVAAFRRGGFDARFLPATIRNDILHGVAQTPSLLSHVFTEVRVADRWVRLDSYIIDPRLREAAVARLHAEGRRIGYGCHVDATGDWDGESNAFSQVAEASMIVDLHEPVDELATFYRSRAYRHRAGGLRYATWLAPLRPFARPLGRRFSADAARVRSASPASLAE
ncbi:MAG: transglutaminase-like domain-containing protein [Actinomycetota bacterium]